MIGSFVPLGTKEDEGTVGGVDIAGTAVSRAHGLALQKKIRRVAKNRID